MLFGHGAQGQGFCSTLLRKDTGEPSFAPPLSIMYHAIFAMRQGTTLFIRFQWKAFLLDPQKLAWGLFHAVGAKALPRQIAESEVRNLCIGKR